MIRLNGFMEVRLLYTIRSSCEALTRIKTRLKVSKPRRRKNVLELEARKQKNRWLTAPLDQEVGSRTERERISLQEQLRSTCLNCHNFLALFTYSIVIKTLRRKSPTPEDKIGFNIDDILKMDSDGLNGLGLSGPAESEEISRGSKASRWFGKTSSEQSEPSKTVKEVPSAVDSKEDAARSLLEMMQKGSGGSHNIEHKKVVTAEELERSAGNLASFLVILISEIDDNLYCDLQANSIITRNAVVMQMKEWMCSTSY